MEEMIFDIQRAKELVKEYPDEQKDTRLQDFIDNDLEELLKKYPDQTIIKVEKEPKLERVLDFQRVYEQNYPPEKEKYDQLFIMLLDEIDELNRAYNQEDKAEIKKEMADVFNCVILLANHLNVDLESEASKKTDRNLRKYNPTKIEKLREENIELRKIREFLRQDWIERQNA